ncbi:hypothetical protein OHA79_50095 (plasmid) [Streptomyces sp. NBC_00841]|uniref:hypothetical protein n=1 Tax=unclassified Streptomyces TaxID=2593676 RepID=UPI0022523F4D|nr:MULTISPECIES: hypothetical protein [unclassified Streptomyces]MCX4538564.1 hypothetical protein [Streptomyces sp. NBC_01669]WSA05612.1 hypothetical protein OHA79_50095 [Streptomyces sp. NBC_00841]
MERFEATCVPGDAYAARKASLDKLGGAIFLLVAAIVSVLISALTGSFLVAQCRIAWDAIRGKPALIASAGRAFPVGLGRIRPSLAGADTYLRHRAGGLHYHRSGRPRPRAGGLGRELTLRFLIGDIVGIGTVKKRKELAARSKQGASNFRAKMSAARVGGTHGSVFTQPAASAVPKNRHIASKTARGLIRGAVVREEATQATGGRRCPVPRAGALGASVAG